MFNNKYMFFLFVQFIDCQWLGCSIMVVLIWMSMDFCDGNQVFFELMNVEKKMCMFKMFCVIGFKEIEIVFLLVLEIEFGFV